jgi:hypothetical protein
MVDIAHTLRDIFPGDHVLLIHDHGNWDEQALTGYNLMIDDSEWPYRGLFERSTSDDRQAICGPAGGRYGHL